MGLFRWAKRKSSRMLGVDQLKYDTKFYMSIFNKAKNPEQLIDEKELPKNFKDIDIHAYYPKEELDSRMSNYLFFVKINIIMFLLIFIYSIYLVLEKFYMSSITSFVVSAIPLIQVLKFHYWYSILKRGKFFTFKNYLFRCNTICKKSNKKT